jgi:uncharacterized CHY-type Zn-finger protein
MDVGGASPGRQTQCVHYHSERDVVAIRFKCCDTFYACIRCHDDLADHTAARWRKDERETRAVLCGNCEKTLSIAEYLGCGNFCPFCGAAFNPRCGDHHEYYFEI